MSCRSELHLEVACGVVAEVLVAALDVVAGALVAVAEEGVAAEADSEPGAGRGCLQEPPGVCSADVGTDAAP